MHGNPVYIGGREGEGATPSNIRLDGVLDGAPGAISQRFLCNNLSCYLHHYQ